MAPPETLPGMLGEAVAALAELHCALWRARDLVAQGTPLEAARAGAQIRGLEATRRQIIESIDASHSKAAARSAAPEVVHG